MDVVLGIALGVAGGVFSVATFHRRNPNYRDAQPFSHRRLWAFKESVWIMSAGLLVGALIAWPLGELNTPYLSFGAAFAAVNYIGLFAWPLIRGWRGSNRPVT